MADDPEDSAISSAIISLGHTLKLEVVAEGVETACQARVLIEQGCLMMQGFWFSPPLDVDNLSSLLTRGRDFSRGLMEGLNRAPAFAARKAADRAGGALVAH